MEGLFTVENLVALLTLGALEIVLGIDNVIFIAILSEKLPEEQQLTGRRLGIGLAVVTRILLLFSIAWVLRLTDDVINIFGNGLSGRDIILLVGGLFLVAKSTREIHDKLEAAETAHLGVERAAATMTSVLAQILLVDAVFSIDSVITAVGISGNLPIMVTAIVIAALFMIFFANRISDFVERHPTMKMLALAFLILIGALLVIEGWAGEAVEELHLRNYAYFAMAFSVIIELLNLRVRRTDQPVQLHNQPRLPREQRAEPIVAE